LVWTAPTSTEVGIVVKSGIAAGLSWWLAGRVTGVQDPVLAPLTAIVVVQVSVRASMRTALQRSAAVVLGVLLGLAVGDALGLSGFSVALLVAVSLGAAELLLRLPPAAARQVPISMLVVLATVGPGQEAAGWERGLATVLGAVVGVGVSFALPASRVVDARQTLNRLADGISSALEDMGAGLAAPWSTTQTEEWRRLARTARDRLVRDATEAVGSGREVAAWNVRDRRHRDELARYEQVLPGLERAAIGVSVISRGLDDHARLEGTTHASMAAMGSLLTTLASAVRASVDAVLDVAGGAEDLDGALSRVRERREACRRAASRRARLAVERDEESGDPHLEGEWLGYAALLVQVDRITADLRAPLPR
jgi:uncharacterized membrane protein YgaE (UPF0421/DUF939 family)